MTSSRLRYGSFSLLVFCAIPGLAAACGGSSSDSPLLVSSGDDSGSPRFDGGILGDGTSDADADAGPNDPGLAELDAGYPAVTVDIAQVTLNSGGKVLSAPHIVTVVWKDDPNLAQIEAFAGAIGSSTYWSTTTAEYGVGAATNENLEIATAPPSSLSEDSLDAFVTSNVKSGAWPAYTDQTVYMIYIPQSVSFTTVDGTGKVVDACATVAGYHTETGYDSESGPYYPYGVIPEACAVGDPTVPTLLASVTATAAHEIIESVTDPLPDVAPGWLYFDPQHYSFEMYNDEQDELADACENYLSSYYLEGADLPFYVQRTWSNESAAAGHDPCVPLAPSEPYYNISISEPDTLTVTAEDGTRHSSEGYRIAPGSTRTIPFTFVSDVPTDGGWFLSAIEGNVIDEVSPSRLTIHVDTPQGVNGQAGSITVTVNSVGDTTAQLITLKSHRGDTPGRYMPILIGTY
jgi:hypothetical protein